MSTTEAKKIAALVARADNGCYECVGSLVGGLKELFPAFDWTALAMEAGKEQGSYWAEYGEF